MRELYGKLYNVCSGLDGFSLASHFVGVKGSPSGNVRLMLIGRACNGWEDDSLRNLPAEEYSAEAEEEWTSSGRWGWIEERGNSLYSTHDSSYCVSRSPFWDYSKDIWEGLTGMHAEGIWMQDILWTNLYKISPAERGNPDADYLTKEKDVCVDILSEEIRDYRPTHLLFLTGWNWFQDFRDIFDVSTPLGRNISRGKYKNSVYVEGTAKTGSADAVIMCRPEYRDKDAYVAAALGAYSELAK